MSILIKGMDMPSKCYECFLQNECNVVNPYFVESTRPQDCPLEEVPSAEPQIIRCKDCKHLESTKRKRKAFYYCCQWDELGNDVLLNDYCSRAERRERKNERAVQQL